MYRIMECFQTLANQEPSHFILALNNCLYSLDNNPRTIKVSRKFYKDRHLKYEDVIQYNKQTQTTEYFDGEEQRWTVIGRNNEIVMELHRREDIQQALTIWLEERYDICFVSRIENILKYANNLENFEGEIVGVKFDINNNSIQISTDSYVLSIDYEKIYFKTNGRNYNWELKKSIVGWPLSFNNILVDLGKMLYIRFGRV